MLAKPFPQLPTSLVILAFALFPASLFAQSATWTNTNNSGSPYYHIGSNWSTGTPPGDTILSTAIFDAVAQYDVWWNEQTVAQTPVVGQVRVRNGGQLRFLNRDESAQHQFRITGTSGLIGESYNNFSIDGSGSQLQISGLHVRNQGGLSMTNGGLLIIDGAHPNGSLFENTGDLAIDVSGELRVNNGGVFQNRNSVRVGREAGTSGVLRVQGNGSTWSSPNGGMSFGYDGHGEGFFNGGSNTESSFVTIGDRVDSSGEVTISGIGTRFETDIFQVGNRSSGTLTIDNQAEVIANNSIYLGRYDTGVGTIDISGENTKLRTNAMSVGYAGAGTFNASNQANIVANNSFTVGSAANGNATFAGTNTHLSAGSIQVGSGANSVGVLNINSNASASTIGLQIGVANDSVGTVNVSEGTVGVSGSLQVGNSGTGTMNINNSGTVYAFNAYIGQFSGDGEVVVTQGGKLTSFGLSVGGGPNFAGTGSGKLSILSNGTVQVQNSTKLWEPGTIEMRGGRFEFGTMSMDEFDAIDKFSGSLAGGLQVSGFRSNDSFGNLNGLSVDVQDVHLVNHGVLFGTGSTDVGLTNSADGELRLLAGESARFGGADNQNAGEIHNFGGTVEFLQSLTNQSGGFISGRGVFAAHSGWNNQGVIAINGTSDFLGDLVNEGNGQIVTTAGATTTFYDDVEHNGSEIRTAGDSKTVFFGAVSGAGDYTGAGTVYFEGDLRPGNSPDIVSFGGDVVLGSSATSVFEIAGLDSGQFDQLRIAGDLFADGALEVNLIDGFELGIAQQFLIADIGGSLNGQFLGLAEGGVVGDWGGRQMFITYRAGDGNDIGLFTAVPEPGSAGVLLATGAMMLIRRRRRSS